MDCDAKPTKTQINLDKCLCHKDGVSGTLSSFTAISWETFRNAAEIRDDYIFKYVGDLWASGPHGMYHRTCYQYYTLKRDLNAIQLKRSHADDPNDASTSASKKTCTTTTRRSCVPLPKLFSCVICQTEKVDKVDRRKIEPLVQCQTFEAGNTLRKFAESKKDERISILLKDTDLIAIEVKYHKTCYRNYTRSKTSDNLNCETDIPTTSVPYAEYDDAFSTLASEIRTRVVDGIEILTMTYLRDRYVDLLQEHGVFSPKYTTNKLKDRIINYFNDEVAVWSPPYRAQSGIVYSNSLPKGMFAQHCLDNTSSADDVSIMPDDIHPADPSSTNYLYHSAKHLRSVLLDQNETMQWPPTTDDIRTDVSLPDDLYNFMSWLITDESEIPINGKVSVSPNVEKTVLSSGQDILYNTIHGKVKTPKHVSLAITVKSLTGSQQLVILLNNFGHCISSPILSEFETALAERQASKQLLIPANIAPGPFTTFVWDNNHILEETLSGGGTTHCTNGIALQTSVDTCRNCPSAGENVVLSGKRSFKPDPQMLLPYVSGKRPYGPEPMPVIDKPTSATNLVELALKLDFAWSVLRLDTLTEVSVSGVQKIPGWAAFNASVTNIADIPRSSTVGYCQVINAPPTQLPVVYNILKRSLQMADEVGQHDVVVVIDQAIYAKALEIVWKNPIEFQRIVPCMGAFHTACTFLSVLGRRFGDAGLRDMLIESGLVG